MAQPPTRQAHPGHEKDPRWTAVDHYATRHLFPQHSPYYHALEHALELSAKHDLPSIEVSALQGKFLALQCRLLRARHVLEVGTLGGYSSIWLASSSAEVKVTSVEIDAKHKAVAEEAIAFASLGDRVEVILGAGNDVLPQMRKDVEAGKREKFDLVFIDADKENNLNYLTEAISMCRPNGLIIVDNVVRQGNLADDEVAKSDSRVQGARKVVEAAGKDDRLECSLLQTVGEKNYDGFLLCIVK